MSGPDVRLNSVTATLACDQCGQHVFVKRILGAPDDKTREVAARQFDTYRRLATAFGPDGPLRVPAPLAQLGDMIALEFIRGTPGDHVLRSADLLTQQTLLGTIGRWFGLFHNSCHITHAHVDLVRRIHDLRESTRQLANNEPVVEDALRFLEGQLPDLVEPRYECVAIHGDAKPGNFLISDATIVGIDVDTVFRGLPEEDLAQFLAQCAMDLSSFGRRFDDDHQEKLESAFLCGYEALRPLKRQALDWLRGYYIVSFWKSTNSRGLLHRLRWTRFFRRRLKRYLVRPHHPLR